MAMNEFGHDGDDQQNNGKAPLQPESPRQPREVGSGDAGWHPPAERPFAAPDDPNLHGAPRGAQGRFKTVRTAIAWGMILIIAGALFFLNNLPTELAATSGPIEADEDTGVAMLRMQTGLLLPTVDDSGNTPTGIRESIEELNAGSVPQRQRYLVVAAELLGADDAIAAAELLRSDLDSAGSDPMTVMTEGQARAQDVLDVLYRRASPEELDSTGVVDSRSPVDLAARVEALSADDRQVLVDELGWFGELALVPRGISDEAARGALVDPLMAKLAVLSVGMILGGLLGCAGFACLVTILILGAVGRVKSRLGESETDHGIYAETFALWLVAFIGLTSVGGLAALAAPEYALGITGVCFFASLIALVWPMMWGVSFKQMREDIGLTLGDQPLLVPAFGVIGYAMALPLLGIGVVLTFVLIEVQAMFTGTVDAATFQSAGGPAHPIIINAGNGDLSTILQLLFVAAIAAPVVEELMFRGVLYKHLRMSTQKAGAIVSVLVGGTVTGFLFAAIHPQGWVAIPALMSLAYAFVILREWRGTVVPSMIIHGISNFLVMSTLVFVIS